MRLGILLIITLIPLLGWSTPQDAVVIEVRKKIKLHPTEIVYPDFFINGGSAIGLEKGTVVSVVRRVPVHDPFQNASIGDFRIKVADVEIIHSDKDKSIARLLEIDRRAERPMVRYDSIMVGDRLDLTTLRQKVAKIESFILPQPQPVEATILDGAGTRQPAQVQGDKKPVMAPPQALPAKIKQP